MKKEQQLKKLLEECPEVQIAVTATKVFYMEEKLNEIDKKVDDLSSWKIKVTAMAATVGAGLSFILTVIFKWVK